MSDDRKTSLDAGASESALDRRRSGMPDRYDVLAIDGELKDLFDDYALSSLRYNDLSWDEVIVLCRLSFARGFVCVIWQASNDREEGT